MPSAHGRMGRLLLNLAQHKQESRLDKSLQDLAHRNGQSSTDAPHNRRRDARRDLMPDRFYRTFSEKQLTNAGAARRSKIEQARLGLLGRHAGKPGRMLEIGPGHGTLADLAVAAGWDYSAIEPSPILAETLRQRGLNVTQAWTPPIGAPDASVDALYADQVLEHMSGIDAARQLTAEAFRVLRPGGIFFVVVPDYLKERGFFWDIDYTHNFITTERRVRQLFYDEGVRDREGRTVHRQRHGW
jgi:SAM-dependent methyltransferase